MFARHAFRPARTLTNSVRRYASEAPKQSSNAALYGALALGAGGAGYWYLNSSKGAVPAPASLKPAEKTFTGGDQGFVSLVLDEVETVSHNTKRFRFKLPSEDHVSGLEVASALLTKYKGPEMQKAVLRPYTPTNDEDARGFLELVVKQYPNGPMSSHLHSMTPGQSLDFKGPLPKFPWTPNKHEHIALIAGGTGITPMYQLMRAIFKNPEDKTKVTLVYGNVGEDDILLKKELHELENTFPQRFRAFYVLDSPPPEWTQGKGRVTKEVLKTVLPEPKEGDKLKIFVCGPPGMYNAISGNKVSPKDQGELSGMLKELGYDKEQVYKF
ncbi:NADH-cytochrome b5 reductase [Diplodia seriata]|uniref:NADH-cytochrome b5 reductase n=1 Tax=Diplodia seriata TaxID=420778 RepID=A0A0G2GMN9_9PEZI|nr:putative nadh-cytochrome b5 [Diplodia seriata]